VKQCIGVEWKCEVVLQVVVYEAGTADRLAALLCGAVGEHVHLTGGSVWQGEQLRAAA
jgi:hypothetical protein